MLIDYFKITLKDSYGKKTFFVDIRLYFLDLIYQFYYQKQ